jgi:hypothetical protein
MSYKGANYIAEGLLVFPRCGLAIVGWAWRCPAWCCDTVSLSLRRRCNTLRQTRTPGFQVVQVGRDSRHDASARRCGANATVSVTAWDKVSVPIMAQDVKVTFVPITAWDVGWLADLP